MVSGEHDNTSQAKRGEQEDRAWYPVYVAVLAFTVFVISALWAFSRYFGS